MSQIVRFNQIVDSEFYRIDLVQDDQGFRSIHIRQEIDERHPQAVLTTICVSG